jgi:hypothetical protein
MNTSSINNQSSTELQQTVDHHDTASTPVSRNPNNITPTYQVTGSPKKKKAICLFATIGIIFVAIFIITSYLFIKSNADKTADGYTTSLKTYITNVYNKVNSPKESPEDIKDFLSKLKRPQLSQVLLESISSKYNAAQTLVITSHDKLSQFDAQMASFITIYNYQQTSEGLVAKAGSSYKPMGDNSKLLSNSLETIKQIKALVDKLQVPSELRSDFTNISNKLGDMTTAFTAVIAAYNTGNQTAIKVANDNFTAISSAESAMEKETLTNYYNGLLNKLIDSVKGLKEYANSIK